MSGASAAEARVRTVNRSSLPQCGMPSVRLEQVMVAYATTRIHGRRREHRGVFVRDTVPEPPVWFHATERGGFCGTWNIESPNHLE